MDARNAGARAAYCLLSNFEKQAGLTSGRRLGMRIGGAIGHGLEFLLGKGHSAGARAARGMRGMAGRARQGVQQFRRGLYPRPPGGPIPPQLDSWVYRAAPKAKRLAKAYGAYAAGEGLYSLGQGDKNLGKSWDQTITKKRVENGPLGATGEYLKRLFLRPTSTVYGTLFGYTKPGVIPSSSSGTWRPGTDNKLYRDARQTGQKPYWLQLREQQFAEAEQRRRMNYEKQRAEVDKMLQELEAEQRRLGQSREDDLSKLRRQFEEQEIAPSAAPKSQTGEAEKKLREYQTVRRGESAQAQNTKSISGSRSSGSSRSASQPSENGSGSEMLLAGAVPTAAAGMLMSGGKRRSKDEEEERKLREILRRYYQSGQVPA